MSCHRFILVALFSGLSFVAGTTGCLSTTPEGPRLDYDSTAFRETLHERVPDLGEPMLRAPFEVPEEVVSRARERVMAAPPGHARVRALVKFLSDPEPRGLGLVYDWATSTTAERTIELGKGDCVALANVLVGLGRGLDWPVFFAEARTERPELHEFEELTVLSDHMVVVVAARTVRMVIDFLGIVDKGYSIRPIDDLTAYAHLVNNVSGRRVVMRHGEGADDPWEAALAGFELATRVQPSLGRAWNNLGIAYAHFERFEEARSAYRRAVELDTAFGSAEHNLTIMETRAQGETMLLESELAR